MLAGVAAAATGGTLIAVAVPVGPASAAVEEATLAENVVVFPERDFLSIEGFADHVGEQATIKVVRDGVTIGTATGLISAGDPALEVNHPGGVCWNAPSTPDILAGDDVQVLLPGEDANGLPVGRHVRTGDVTVTEPAHLEDVNGDGEDDVVVRGTATNLDTGTKLPVADVEQRIVAPELVDTEVGRRDIRAPGLGTFRYDNPADPTDTRWTAAYTTLAPATRDIAVSGQSRVMTWHEDPETLERAGITIFEYGEVGGPGMGGCPAASRYAVTGTNPASLNAVTAARDLVVSGVSRDATQVVVTVDDDDPATPAVSSQSVTPGAATGSQTWSATIPAAAHGGLSQGELTVSASYTVPNGTDPVTGEPVFTEISGATFQILKDTVAPAAPTATPPGGEYNNTQFVGLDSGDEGVVIRYRTGTTGSTPDPTATSTRYTGTQIAISASQTLKARAYDAAGNASPVATHDYVIRTATAPGAPTNVAGAPGARAGEVNVSWTAPTNNGGAAITRYTVRRSSIEGTFDTVVGTTPAATIANLTPGVPYTFRVFATNIAGDGALSTASAPVSPRAPETAPGQVAQPTATARNASATVSWTRPTGNVTEYRVQVRTGTTQVGVLRVVPASQTSLNVTGLANGTRYNFRVRAVNGTVTPALVGAYSVASNAVTPTQTRPGAPTIGTAAAGSTTDGAVSATARWTAPANDGGSAITSYVVTARRVSNGVTTTRTTTNVGSLRFTGLVNGATYRFSVQAVNAIGTGTASALSNQVIAR